jgi:hypothetical protein
MIVLMMAAHYGIITDASTTSLPAFLNPLAMLTTWLILGVVAGV